MTREELSAYVDAVAESQRTTPAKLAKQISDAEGWGMMGAQLRDVKVMQVVLAAAKTPDGKGILDALNDDAPAAGE